MNSVAKKRSNKKKSIIVYLFVVTLIIWFVFNGLFGAANPNDTQLKEVNIKSGYSTAQIAYVLKEAQIINNETAYRLYVKFAGVENKLKAGSYRLSPNMTLKEITNTLIKGQSVNITFTIPEGFTTQEICELLTKKGLVKEDKFWQIIMEEPFSEYEFLKELPRSDKRLEGYLFPDTYTIAEGTSEKAIIKMMLDRFKEIFEGLPENKSNLSMRELVILASVIENEALLDKERPIIASVFLNRLDIKMNLQSCATVQYALPERKKDLLTKDLELDSPYNTYIHNGLPPGPIGNPGRASLEAVCQPAQTDYFYFNARYDGSGGHYFSKNHDEHIINKRKAESNQKKQG